MKKIPDTYKHFLILLFSIYVLEGCSNRTEPKRVYMPDMYYSEAYEPYAHPIRPYRKGNNTVPLFKNYITSLLPVNGTVTRTEDGSLPYILPNSNEGYKASLEILNSPLDLNQRTENLERGKAMYQINCVICHGDIGDGRGELVKNEKILGVPNYKDRDITIGSIYHVIMYGRNNMGSYASQLTPEDRWKVAEYVMILKK